MKILDEAEGKQRGLLQHPGEWWLAVGLGIGCGCDLTGGTLRFSPSPVAVGTLGSSYPTHWGKDGMRPSNLGYTFT